LSAVLRFQDYQYQVVLINGAWKWTTRVDVSQAVVIVQVRDIITPYGLLRDSVPIPGEVVQAMADSITEVRQAYTPSILLNPVNLDFIVDEGRGVSAAKSVLVTNNGILGSLLATTITSSVSYVFSLPANVDGLVAHASGSFDVSVDSANLLAVGSPYAANLTVQDVNATNNPQIIPVGVIVRPKAIISVAPTSLQFNVAAPLTGDFPPIPSQQILLTNSGPATSVLDFQIRKLIGVPWLVSYSPVFGSLNGAASQPITIVVSPPSFMGVGVYTETLRVTGYSTNMSVDITVTLNIS